MLNLETIIGIVGLVLLLTSFILDFLDKIREKSYRYLILNGVGSGLLAYYAYSLGSMPFLILELVWMFFSIYEVIKFKKINRKD